MLDSIRSLKAYQNLLEDLRARLPLPGLALMRSARIPLAESLREDLRRPVFLITDRADHALYWFDELSFWAKGLPVYLFPEPVPLFYEPAAWGANVRRDRIQVLTLLARYAIPGVSKPEVPPIIVAPIRAVMTRTLPRREFLKASKQIRQGQTISLEALKRWWVEVGYQPMDTVLEPGQFSHRGGILDIWPPAETFPVRLEFFGDEIETLRTFDPSTQRKIQPISSVLITPAREVLPGKAAELNLALQDVDEFYLPLVHTAPASVLEFLPQNALVVLDDLDLLQTFSNEIEEQAVKTRRDSINEGLLEKDFPVPYLSFSEIKEILSAYSWLELGRGTATENSPLAEAFQPGPRFGGRLKSFVEFMLSGCREHQRFFILSRQVGRIREVWQEQSEQYPDICQPDFMEGTLSEGWVLTQDDGRQVFLFTDSEIFGWDRPQPRGRARQAVTPPEAEYTDFKVGDYIVHVDYGIGRFAGLSRRTVDGVEREYLAIEYEGGDTIFVPVYQADRLTRYVGPSGETPSLTHLGGMEWASVKQRVRESVLEVAQELLELYAKRQVAKGHAFSADTVWQKELEASFPYIETEDQIKAIQAVKRDMERPRPMDRLLCGDVGYGKTEVALRAAFKAVMDGKQVAMLVPTTVLAQQHFETFRQRLAPFPVMVEMLSRFRTPKEQERILQQLREGTVDIIIGTHRLLQPDVAFKDLGLVIIDEEQRFGVTHKEYFKKLRTEVDVLTLTATPIPRTLYMALTGVRDISQINTPPAERLPIITHIGPYSPRLVRQAILREIERGGQVFFVHNRVQTIHAMERHLQKLVPEARIGIAHGQMPEEALSRVMMAFTRGELDVLLCTSIIESGLDIPNANTLIVDRGDTFGLAQLYQLRGRVGRGAQRAYAYFFRHRRKAPTPEGQERLEIIAENTQLGSGYSIAMRDLEMRGAGELLGTRQHGMIAAVGFHLYTRLLAQAVRQIREVSGISVSAEEELKGGIPNPVNVDLPLAMGIPVSYIPDQHLRLKLYRRLADVEREDELDALEEEFRDRFGPIPEQVKNLIYQMRVKLYAQKVGLSSVSFEGDQIVLRFPPLPEGLSERGLPPLGRDVRAGKNAYWLLAQAQNWQERLLEVLKGIDEHVHRVAH